MMSKRITASLATAALLLGLSTHALADHDNRSYRAASVSSGGYAHKSGPIYDFAQVISSRPIVRYVTITEPVKECWEETEYYTIDHRPYRHAGSTLFGAIVGGVVGHQFGSGRGNDAATVAGTLLGAAIANDASRRRHAGKYGPVQYSRPVTRCATQYREHQEERIEGYDVTYRYKGQKYATRMPHDPGRKIRIRVDIRPVG